MNGSCLLILLILCAMNRCCGEACRGGSNTSSCGCGCGTQSVIQPRKERPENSKGDCRKEQETCCEGSHAERASSDCGCQMDPEPCFEQVRPFMSYQNTNLHPNPGCGCGKN